MNWQTKEILESAKEKVNDQGVFSEDQITLLHKMIDKIGAAIDKEMGCQGQRVS